MPDKQNKPSSAGETLSHIGPDGSGRMVDVSAKPVTRREACASGKICMRPEVLDLLMQGALPKGDALATARVAGVQAAKRTGALIPFCHPLALDWVDIQFSRTGPDCLAIQCTARVQARTGVEMEALTGVSAAALTIYDMAKAADKAMMIKDIQLESKSGGKTDFRRAGKGP